MRTRLHQARIDFEAGEVERAEQQVAALLPVYRSGGRAMDLAELLVLQGQILAHEELFEAAAAAFGEAVELRRATLVPGNWQAAIVTSLQGESLAKLRYFERAEPLLLQGAEELHAALGPEHALGRAALRRTQDLYEAWERPEEAARVRARLGASGDG